MHFEGHNEFMFSTFRVKLIGIQWIWLILSAFMSLIIKLAFTLARRLLFLVQKYLDLSSE